MTEHIGLLARLFRGMADRIDQDRRSPTRHEAIGNAGEGRGGPRRGRGHGGRAVMGR
jgi:hypothetical protein